MFNARFAVLGALTAAQVANNYNVDAQSFGLGSTVEAPHYRAYNVGELAHRTTVDGKALATGGTGVGEGYIDFNGKPTLSTNDTFSIWGRVKQLSNLGGDQFIFSRPGAWGLRVDADGDLLPSFGGVTQDTGFNAHFRLFTFPRKMAAGEQILLAFLCAFWYTIYSLAHIVKNSVLPNHTHPHCTFIRRHFQVATS